METIAFSHCTVHARGLMIAELELTAQLTAQRPRALLYFSSETESLPPAEWSHTLFKFSVLRRQ